jgi:hypothetical protein
VVTAPASSDSSPISRPVLTTPSTLSTRVISG